MRSTRSRAICEKQKVKISRYPTVSSSIRPAGLPTLRLPLDPCCIRTFLGMERRDRVCSLSLEAISARFVSCAVAGKKARISRRFPSSFSTAKTGSRSNFPTARFPFLLFSVVFSTSASLQGTEEWSVSGINARKERLMLHGE
jgi:hypothetical protein